MSIYSMGSPVKSLRFGMYASSAGAKTGSGISGSGKDPFDQKLITFINMDSPLNANLFPHLSLLFALLHHPSIVNQLTTPEQQQARESAIKIIRNLGRSAYEYGKKPLSPEAENLLKKKWETLSPNAPIPDKVRAIYENLLGSTDLDSESTKAAAQLKEPDQVAFPLESLALNISNASSSPMIPTQGYPLILKTSKAWSNPISRLEAFEALESNLRNNIIGQDAAIGELLQIVDQACVMKTPRYKERGQKGLPRLVVLLAGPSGVGKTQTVELLKQFGNREIIPLDGGNYSDDIHTNRIMGSGPGYANNEDPTLVDDIVAACKRAKQAGKEPPIILIDEIDKASKRFFTIWNGVFSEGRLERRGSINDQGEYDPLVNLKADFKGVDIFCTANFAQHKITNYLKNKGKITLQDKAEILKFIKEDASKTKNVNPDFWGRFIALIPYQNLSESAVRQITSNTIIKHKDQYKLRRGVDLQISPEVIEKIIHTGYSADEGCRHLQNQIALHIDGALSGLSHELMRKGRWKKNLPGINNDQIALTLSPTGAVQATLLGENSVSKTADPSLFQRYWGR